MSRQHLIVLGELTLGSGEPIEDNSLLGFGLLEFFLDDIDDDAIVHQSTGVDDFFDLRGEALIEGAGSIALENLADFISSGNVVHLQILGENLGVGALSDSRSSEQEHELLLVGSKAEGLTPGETLHNFERYFILGERY